MKKIKKQTFTGIYGRWNTAGLKLLTKKADATFTICTWSLLKGINMILCISRLLFGLSFFMLAGCGSPKFSGTAKPSKLSPQANTAADSKMSTDGSTDKQAAKQESLNLDPVSDNDLNKACYSLFGVSAGSSCKIPTKSLFGGTFQTGTTALNTLVNPGSNKTQCDASYVSYPLGQTATPGGLIRLFMCWSSDTPKVTNGSQSDCPKDQTFSIIGDKKVCSDIPVKACSSLDGTFDYSTGKCLLQPFKTVFGGVFETGEASTQYPKVTIVDSDDGMKSKQENCETPNKIGGFSSSCQCPAGFAVFSSSGIVETGPAGTNPFDRYNYCFRQPSASLILTASSEPESGCKNRNELKQFINGVQVCTDSVARLCNTVGGIFNTTSQKCLLPQEEFFGGAFQVGEADLAKETPVLTQDPSEKRTQLCESANPLAKSSKDPSKSAGCKCPDGFKAQVFILADESEDRKNYDREYLCIIDR